MFECSNLSIAAGRSGEKILNDVSARFPHRKLCALVGPSGCGKTTLLRAFLGLVDYEGALTIDGEPGAEHSSDLGFVPQFSVAYQNLTVEEAVNYAYKLTVMRDRREADKVAKTLDLVSLSEHLDKRVSNLSGGQLRRLGLALELVSDPECLICDEVTSGLDPLSENQIIELLRKLVETQDKTLICTIHNLGKLPEFDYITLLYKGVLIFQGTFPELQTWFDLEDPLRLYQTLDAYPPEHWVRRWHKAKSTVESSTINDDKDAVVHKPVAVKPGWGNQCATLLNRRLVLFFRDKGYLLLLLALTFGFPCVVVIFALGGLPQIETLSLEAQGGFTQRMQNDLRYRIEAAETATLVTGLIMFQAILLTLMGSNNGAREIAAERPIFEKERLRGLSPLAYAFSKLSFTGTIALFQGFWMAFFVKIVCQFPGPYLPQLVIMGLCCLAMTFMCLAISAVLSSPEKAALVSVYIVGFQLPLSGVVLALPDSMVWLFRPFINAYWSWAGYIGTMREHAIYDAFRLGNISWLPEPSVAIAVLLAHCAVSAALVLIGCARR